MKIIRRKFLKLGIFSSLLAGLPQQAYSEPKPEDRFWPFDKEVEPSQFHKRSVLQGATDETKTQFSILNPREEKLNIYIKSSRGEFILPDHVEELTYLDHPTKISKVYVSNLEPDQEYQLILESDEQEVLDQRTFKSLSLQREDVRFALASCMDDENHAPGIWTDMVENSPDVIFFVGDSVYADRLRGSAERRAADPEQLWVRFCQARFTLEIYQSKKLIPIVALWDDHDFGQNDTGKSYPYVKESQQNFISFFAQEESHSSLLSRGPGVGSAFKIKDQLFLMLDGRSFRETSSSYGRFDHWGEEQEEWALDLIDQHQGFVWIMTGSQIFPSMIFKESVSKQHPNHLKGFVEELRKRQAHVAFVSGDVHFSEISEIESRVMGYKTYEFTSSSIHSTTFPGVPDLIPNKRRIESTGKRNYLLIQSQYSGEEMKLKVKSHSEKGRTNFSREFTI